jgi:hypothetical protein
MKKIMFNDQYGLTKAVLSGYKTVTRRIMNRQPDPDDIAYMEPKDYPCQPPYKVGEIVAVAQRYQELDNEWCRNHVGVHPAESPYSSCENMAGWNNKMFVRAEACKHQIRITSVRPERLQNITDEDCIKEGIFEEPFPFGEGYCFDPIFPRCHKTNFNTPREAFASLMDKISGRGTWEQNPFVWRIEFKLVK